MKRVTRREFFTVGVGLTAVAGGLETICGCATTETAKVETLDYPLLPYHKIQPPKEGCFVGFFSMYGITHLEKALSLKPSIFIAASKLYNKFPMAQVIDVAKRGIMSYLHVDIAPFDSIAPISGFSVKEIARGQQDGHIKEFAQYALEFGKEYRGFFFSTMVDMNGNWFSWGKNPNFIPAWRRIWQIFEDQGTNQYATWVWVPYCPEASKQHADNPELYYPGDKYVDWIGINAFSVAGHPKVDNRLNVLMRETYRQLFKNHEQKPFMMPWFARTNVVCQEV